MGRTVPDRAGGQPHWWGTLDPRAGSCGQELNLWISRIIQQRHFPSRWPRWEGIVQGGSLRSVYGRQYRLRVLTGRPLAICQCMAPLVPADLYVTAMVMTSTKLGCQDRTPSGAMPGQVLLAALSL